MDYETLARKVEDNVGADRVLEAVESGDDIGFCVECGEEVLGIEPDAREYRCDACGAIAVFGAEELLIHI